VADKVTTVPVPAAAQPVVEYEIAVVAAARDRTRADAFVARVLGDAGRAALRERGFGLPGAG
jgi:ABC-type molybdate transport system substrate-binding protein